MLKLNRWAPYIALALILAAAGLRLYRLGDKNVWWDEGYTVFMMRLPLARMLDATAHDTHPPLYYALLHGWQLLAGDSEFALRLPSALAGVLVVPILFRLARALAGTRAALTATTLVAVSRVLVWYSQEIRQYMFATLLALASLALAYALRRGARLAWPAYVAVTLAGLLSLYLFVGVLLAENLAALFAAAQAGPWHKSPAVRWLSAQAAVAAGCLPWLLYYLPRAPHHFSVATPLNLAEVIKLYLNAVIIGNPTDIDRYMPVVLAFVALLLGGTLITRRTRSTAQAFGLAGLVLGAVTPPLLVWLVNLPTPYQLSFTPNPRYFLTQIPWSLAVLGIALAGAGRRWPRAGLLAGGFVLVVFGFFTGDYYSDRHRSDDYAGAAATVGAFRQPDDAVFLHNDRDWPIVAYHLGRYPMGTDWIGLNGGQQITSESDAAGVLEPAWSAHSGAWLLLTQEALVNDPDRRVLGWLSAHAVAWREFDYEPTAQLFLFARTQARAATIDQLAAAAPAAGTIGLSAAPGLTLLQAKWTLPEYRTGEMLHLFLYWRNARAPGSYDFAVRLSGSDGVTAEEIPATLALTPASPGLVRQQVDLPIRATVGSGRYDLNILAGQAWASLGSISITAAPAQSAGSSPVVQAQTKFEGGVTLLGYTPKLTQGTLDLTLYWKNSDPMDQPYKLFAHLLGPAANPAKGHVSLAQWDGEPSAGPITSWPAGQTTATGVELALPTDRPPGKYQVEVGWYDGLTGQRLMVVDGSGAAIDSQVVLGPFNSPTQ